MLNSFPMPPLAHHEIEIKLRIADPPALRRRLRALGARLFSSVHERNVVFDTPQQRLRKKGQLLRLRLESARGRSKASVRAVLTYKGPAVPRLGRFSRAPRRYKIREEVETPVSHPALLERILAGLGLHPSFRYEKYRSTYRLPRLSGVLIDLDKTPIGLFLELEGSPRAIDRAARLLGFTPDDYRVSSYAALYFNHCRLRGIAPGDMLFPRQKKSRSPSLLP
jgi:adenylate cyclase, class 2